MSARTPKPAFLRPPSAQEAKALDREMSRKAVREIRAKYLIGQLGRTYGSTPIGTGEGGRQVNKGRGVAGPRGGGGEVRIILFTHS